MILNTLNLPGIGRRRFPVVPQGRKGVQVDLQRTPDSPRDSPAVSAVSAGHGDEGCFGTTEGDRKAGQGFFGDTYGINYDFWTPSMRSPGFDT